jgi:hypothetical protein
MNAILIGNFTFRPHLIAATAQWPDEPGIYAYVKADPHLLMQVLYIGKTESFRDRFYSHHRWDEALKRGATHLCLCKMDTRAQDEAESQLIKQFNPVLNVTHRNGPPLGRVPVMSLNQLAGLAVARAEANVRSIAVAGLAGLGIAGSQSARQGVPLRSPALFGIQPPSVASGNPLVDLLGLADKPKK